jgi:hydroxymethylbilane synthase
VAAYAELTGDGRLELAAFVGMPDGSTWIRDTVEGPATDPASLGREIAERLLAAGAGEVLAAAQLG